MEVDARGQACPRPVLMTREALEDGREEFSVLVDNEAARENVLRFANKAGCSVGVVETDFGFRLDINLKEPPEAASGDQTEMNRVLLISSDRLGRGSEELGRTLMKAFLYSCTENPQLPRTLVLMNAGVRLATENRETIEHLELLIELGCELLVCGTCLDFFGLKERLAVGRVSNMYEIQSILIAAGLLVSV